MINSTAASKDLVDCAYRLLKQDAYYDKMDLFLRAVLAEFESDHEGFHKALATLAEIVDDLRSPKLSPETVATIKKWIDRVDFRMFPKSVDLPHQNPLEHENTDTQNKPQKDESRFITNVRTDDEYRIAEQGGVQYFIHAPVEIYILSTLWCMTCGTTLDQQLDPWCLGNRLEQQVDDLNKQSRLFKIFHYQYEKWRNTAIERAESLLEQGTSSVLVSLDVKQCYYHLEVKWDDTDLTDLVFGHLGKHLARILDRVHSVYHGKIKSYLEQTHGADIAKIKGIPIGLPSSRILANWLLRHFDSAVNSVLRPSYYGRYVDDMLLVTQAPSKDVLRSGVKGVIHELFVKNGLFKDLSSASSYQLASNPSLTIQSSKLIVHHFDKEHSRAGLKEFIREIKRDASDFKFLPADDNGRELDACAYDIIYEGSINKLRSVIGVRENSSELGKYLARRMVEHRLTADALNKTVTEQLSRFARGKNLLDFCTTWERILSLLIVKKQHVKAAEMLKRCIETIDRLRDGTGESPNWILKIKSDLQEFLLLSLALPLGLLERGGKDALKSKRLNAIIKAKFENVFIKAQHMRHSNMIRHQWVAWPLLNYTSYQGSLVELDERLLENMEREGWSTDRAEPWSPRYIHADERQLFDLLYGNYAHSANRETPAQVHAERIFFNEPPPMYDGFNDDNQYDIQWNPENADSIDCPDIYRVIIPGVDVDRLAIGIANLQVNEGNIAASYEPGRKPNMSWDRQCQLFRLLNTAETDEKCDMLILPEVSVPYSWLPFMVSHARHANIALVFGLEHWVCGRVAYNLLVTVLPFSARSGKQRACRVFVRPKNHYSPAEKTALQKLNLDNPEISHSYHLFEWRGIRFTVFNCFELTDIKHRSAFRSDIDMLIGVEWNPDTPYFSNIVESTVRDLYCYMVQVNTSQYGDSRITAPRKSIEMNAVRVSGGENTALLKATIDIKTLNDCRAKRVIGDRDDAYKPAPAGFDHDKVRDHLRNRARR